jgi:hypothetical protein
MRVIEVISFCEIVIAAAKANWLRRKGRPIVVRRTVIDMVDKLTAETLAKGFKAENAISLAEKRREGVRDKAGAKFWREVVYYMTYIDTFRQPEAPWRENFQQAEPEEKPDVLVIEDG